MTGNEVSATGSDPRLAYVVGDLWRASSRPTLPVPVSRIEGDAVIPDDDDPWLEDEETDEDGFVPEPKRPFWNR